PEEQGRKFAACMRENGVDMEDPGGDGGVRVFRKGSGDIKKVEEAMESCRQYAPVKDRAEIYSDVAPGRKIDPGEKFPWRRLAEEGVGLFVEPAKGNDGPTIGLGSSGRAVEELQAMLARYGYGIEVSGRYEQKTQSIVAAFQRHFRPQRVDGIADGGTMA